MKFLCGLSRPHPASAVRLNLNAQPSGRKWQRLGRVKSTTSEKQRTPVNL
jgi:hypothetical protein